MSANVRRGTEFQAGRNFQKKQQNNNPTVRQPLSKRQAVGRNLPKSNIRQSIGQTTRRMQKIKSPFSNDQTRTITTKTNLSKKRKVGQIPLRDRQHGKIKINQKAGSGLGSQVRKLAQKQKQKPKQSQVQFGQKKKSRNQFNRKNKTQKEIDQVFKFDSNRSFF